MIRCKKQQIYKLTCIQANSVLQYFVLNIKKEVYILQDNRKLLGVRVSPELHKIIKQTALNNDVTIQDYVVGLIMADVSMDGKTKTDFWKELKAERG